MNFDVKTTPHFDKELKKLVKKYVSIKNDLAELIDLLSENPIQGTDLGNDTYKIRLAITSKQKGKRGGARVISVVIHSDKEVVLVSIYDKSEQDNIPDKKLKDLVEGLKD